MSINDFDDFDQPLRTAGGTRYPSVKFTEPGQAFIGMVVDYDDKAPLFEYGTNERKLNGKGEPATKDVLTVIVMAGTSCPVTDPDGGEDTYLDDPTGVVAKVHIQGHNRYTADPRPDGQRPAWRNAVDTFGDFRRGCVVRGVFEATSRTGSNGAKLSQDKKIVGFQIRAAKPEEADLTNQARAAYRAIKEAKAAAADQPKGGTPDYVRSGASVPVGDAF